MLYLEMARDPAHGGGSWGFTKCVWSPTQKEKGGEWPFWNKILGIREADIVLHLRGVTPNAEFVGFSTAAGPGFETSSRPPDPKTWSFSSHYFRADLRDFVPFHKPFNLDDVFRTRRQQLEQYFDRNKASGKLKKNIFYVRQTGRLRCLNGAYLSEVDDPLFEALFGEPTPFATAPRTNVISVATRTQLIEVKGRIGQAAFSKKIRKMYGNRCCFPGCVVSDDRFLICAHIARWSDNEALRGNPGNGLCLCLTHDKAFELGVYTLDESFRIFVNPKESSEKSDVVKEIRRHHGKSIRLGEVNPILDALLEHWNRVEITPLAT